MSQKIEDKADAAEDRTQQTRGFMQQVRVVARRKYGTVLFTIDFLKGNGPRNSKEIGPDIGSPVRDIRFECRCVRPRWVR